MRILTFYPGGVFEAEARARNVAIRCLHKQGRWDVRGFLSRLHSAINSRRPDVIHSYMGAANLAVAALKPMLRRPLVWGLRASNQDLSKYDRMASVSRRVEIAMASSADLIIANSEAGRRHAVTVGFPERTITVVENGFELDRWRRNPEAGRVFRRAHRIPQEAPLFGVVGRLDPVKGHDVFLRAAAAVRGRHPEARFAAIGSGPPDIQRSLESESRAAGLSPVFHWIPSQDDMVAVYSALDTLVSTSLSEGFPNVVAEGMACGLRPVVTDVGDSARIAGSCGWVIPPGDAAALAAAMNSVLEMDNQPTDARRPDPRAHIESAFGVDRLVERTESLLRQVTDRDGGREGTP